MTLLSIELVDTVVQKADARLRMRTLLPFYECRLKLNFLWKSVVGRNDNQKHFHDDSDTSLSVDCALCTHKLPRVLQHYYLATCRRQQGLII